MSTTWIGVVLALCASILVNVGLNIQKFAHMKLARENPDVEVGKTKKSAFSSFTWVLGLATQMGGEGAVVMAYAFAPTSTVAPLGATGLLANLVITTCFLKEEFRKLDVVGALLCTGGSGLIAAFSPTPPTAMSLQDLTHDHLLTKRTLVFYPSISVFAVLIYYLYKHKWITTLLAPLTISACCSAYSLFSVKSLLLLVGQSIEDGDSENLANALFPLLFPMLAVSGCAQIYWLNKALSNFDASSVVPTYYVFFSMTAIAVGSVVFHDFEGMKDTKTTFFAVGVTMCMFGVILINYTRLALLTEEEDDDNNNNNDKNSSEQEPLFSKGRSSEQTPNPFLSENEVLSVLKRLRQHARPGVTKSKHTTMSFGSLAPLVHMESPRTPRRHQHNSTTTPRTTATRTMSMTMTKMGDQDARCTDV